MNKAEKILQDVKQSYNLIAEHFSQTRAAPWPCFKLFSEYIRSGQKILDLGCGNGRLYFTSLKDYNLEYYGLDVSERLVEIAQTKNLKFKTKNSHFQVGEITKLPYADNFFDLVICVAAFHHLPNKKLRLKSLSEIYRALKPGGYLLMTNWHLWHRPYFKHWFKQFFQKISLKDFFVPWKSSAGKIKCYRYFHVFTKAELSGLLATAGFKTEKIFFSTDPNSRVYGRGVTLVSVARKI